MQTIAPIDPATREKIDAELDQLVNEQNLTLLLAVESGSRAWGFPSTDSDYDVRFLYLRPLDWYLSVAERADTITKPIVEGMDLSGWDIRKALRLLAGSNMALFEWASSPVVYAADPEFMNGLRGLMEECFQPRSALNHYMGMTRKYWTAMIDAGEVRLKHYCYTLRTGLSCRWIIERGTPPPMDLASLRVLLDDQPEVQSRIDALIEQKAAADELTVVPRDPLLHPLITSMVESAAARGSELSGGGGDGQQLDIFFRSLLGVER